MNKIEMYLKSLYLPGYVATDSVTIDKYQSFFTYNMVYLNYFHHHMHAVLDLLSSFFPLCDIFVPIIIVILLSCTCINAS